MKIGDLTAEGQKRLGKSRLGEGIEAFK